MTQVIRENDEILDALMRRLKKTVHQERALSEIRKRRYYEKPSQERKRQAERALGKSRRTTQKDLLRH